MDLTHASFFSGVGGLDLGLERAGWRTVSFSEIDPYASAVLAERWPGVPNLGDITDVANECEHDWSCWDDGDEWAPRRGAGCICTRCNVIRPDERSLLRQHRRTGEPAAGGEWHRAVLWTGGFPCQDLSVAGKRRGMVDGTRSNLAHAFLDLVERHRPSAILLENVPGLLSSHRGRDMAALLGRMAELGYGVAYRVLDARHFGVPQRRRRVFIVGLRSEADDPSGRLAAERAAAVLAVGSRCRRHPPAGVEAGPDAPDGLGGGIRGALSVGGHVGIQPNGQDAYTGELIVGPSPDPGGVRAPDGLAGRLDGGEELAGTLLAPTDGGRRDRIPLAFTKARRAQTADAAESWREGSVMPTLNDFDTGDVRMTAAVVGSGVDDDPLLPLGLDSHRYRCCGNGVVANVAKWLGRRLAEALA